MTTPLASIIRIAVLGLVYLDFCKNKTFIIFNIFDIVSVKQYQSIETRRTLLDLVK